MSLSSHHKAMERLYTASISQASSRPAQKLFSQGLKHLLENSPAFDACVGEDNPFYQEFVLQLQTNICLEEDCLSLFECLAIFFRLRQMAANGVPLDGIERKVLHFFETCGEWQPQDPTIVSFWYWWRIPLQATH